jgi:hypothetical protein
MDLQRKPLETCRRPRRVDQRKQSNTELGTNARCMHLEGHVLFFPIIVRDPQIIYRGFMCLVFNRKFTFLLGICSLLPIEIRS